MKPKALLTFLIIIIIAGAVRFTGLSLRPMHGDEAVNAVKLGQLLDSGRFIYNPDEYHGPTLYYGSWLTARAAGQTSLQQLSEQSLRSFSVLISLGIFLLLLLIRKQLGGRVVLIGALFMAISAGMVFYSRYFIHEILLVFFLYGTLVFSYRFIRTKSIWHAAAGGLCFGLMAATKETWIIVSASAFFSSLLVWFQNDKRLKNVPDIISAFPLKNFPVYLAVALLAVFLLFSSFLQNIQGFTDGLSAFSSYFQRGTGGSVHNQPWYRYLEWLFYFHQKDSPLFWSEGLIGLLAITGTVFAIFKKDDWPDRQNILRFISYFAWITLFIFSLIPYKTPWNLLVFWPAMLLISASGLNELFLFFRNKRIRPVLITAITIGIFHMGWQAYQLNFIYHCDPVNPFVYAHPVKDVLNIEQKFHQLSAQVENTADIHIEVIVPKNDYWPLPWYLRSFPTTGYWDTVDPDSPAGDIILISPSLEPALIRKLYEHPPAGERKLYVPFFENYTELRPGKELRAYISLELWNRIQPETILQEYK